MPSDLPGLRSQGGAPSWHSGQGSTPHAEAGISLWPRRCGGDGVLPHSWNWPEQAAPAGPSVLDFARGDERLLGASARPGRSRGRRAPGRAKPPLELPALPGGPPHAGGDRGLPRGARPLRRAPGGGSGGSGGSPVSPVGHVGPRLRSSCTARGPGAPWRPHSQAVLEWLPTAWLLARTGADPVLAESAGGRLAFGGA